MKELLISGLGQKDVSWIHQNLPAWTGAQIDSAVMRGAGVAQVTFPDVATASRVAQAIDGKLGLVVRPFVELASATASHLSFPTGGDHLGYTLEHLNGGVNGRITDRLVERPLERPVDRVVDRLIRRPHERPYQWE